MKRRLFYTKKTLYWFRILSILCALLLTVSEICGLYKIFTNKGYNLIDNYTKFGHCINIISILFFSFTFFFPQKFGFTAIVSFVYATSIIFFETKNHMGIMMYFLGTEILFARGLMKEHQRTKLIILLIFLFCLILGQLRFGINAFLNLLFTSIGFCLVFGLFIFFLRAYCLNNLMYEDKKLNLACYPKLTERDYEILKMIQQGEKYTLIAKHNCLSLGSLKNRLHIVFDILETGDKQGFLSYYSDWELCYNPETAEEDFARMHRN